AGVLYGAAGTASRVLVLELGQERVSRTFDLEGPVAGLALTPDGARLLATEAVPEGRLALIDTESGRIRRIEVGHTPSAVAVTPDGKKAYVCNRFHNDVSVVDLSAGRERNRIPVLREPVACGLTPDGKRLYVANHLPAGRADGEYAAAAVSVIDTDAGAVASTVLLPNGSTGVRGLCLSADGAFVYVTHLLGRYQLPTTQLERGWMNTNALTVIDALTGAYVNTVLLDDVDLGGANPWGVACSADGTWLAAAHAGTHEISIVDRAGLHERLAKVARGERVTQVSEKAEDVPNDLSFLVGLRRRLSLAGNGPRGIAVLDSRVYAAEYFSDSVGLVSLDPEAVHRPKSIPLGPAQEPTLERLGERHFNDARMCFQHWQSCGSCHPDGRADGLNWDLLNDGMGNPKQTKSLLLSHRTPPAMITGVRPDAEAAVRKGMTFIQFAVRPEEDLVAIDAYLKSMQPVPSPHLEKGELSRLARRGRRIFEEAACAQCHPEPLYTDRKPYNVGLGLDPHRDAAFDTPTLIENWRTAPFLYDGRAATMRDVLRTFNPGDTHGRTSGLSEDDLAALEAFILSQ
ncbi:MAG: cell surface protein, partial [Lentisphaeria bacterium]|nr:cell surface protein [Lentisphaeria bacterium]